MKIGRKPTFHQTPQLCYPNVEDLCHLFWDIYYDFMPKKHNTCTTCFWFHLDYTTCSKRVRLLNVMPRIFSRCLTSSQSQMMNWHQNLSTSFQFDHYSDYSYISRYFEVLYVFCPTGGFFSLSTLAGSQPKKARRIVETSEWRMDSVLPSQGRWRTFEIYDDDPLRLKRDAFFSGTKVRQRAAWWIWC